MYTIDVIIKIISMGLLFNKKSYLKYIENWIDLFATIFRYKF